MTNRSARTWTARAALALLPLGGCAAERDDAELETAAQVASGASLDAGAPLLDASPGAADAGDAAVPSFTAAVTASGSGCPAGSWKAEVSPDNRHFAISYDAHDVEVGAQTASAEKDCWLNVKLRAQSGVSFGVEKYAHNGYALLEKGVQGKQTTSYWFESARVTSRSRNTYLSGPFDDAYRSEPLKESDLFWTACALERSLLVVTRVQLRNDGSGAKGYAALTSAVDEARADVELDLVARPCALPVTP